MGYSERITYPYGPTPIRVAAEHTRMGIAGPIVHFITLTMNVHAPWVIFMHL